MLEKFDFPKGILPEGVPSYELKDDGSFTVFLASNCEFKVDGGYLLKYDSKITGKVDARALTDVKGVSVKVLFAWFSIGSVARSDAALNFYVGPLSATFPVANFEECPRCRCGFDCATAASIATHKDRILKFSVETMEIKDDSLKTSIHSAVAEKVNFLGMELQAVPPSSSSSMGRTVQSVSRSRHQNN
ncbi:hypothetical protein ZIOFF_011355 [Zingiber officinale]|uniref:Uncharacterized protein n=1 Tax=Zingiber officinale TaxID=94328 RepID=A0A8J5LQ00_ZINOF|nr:hypothetical protein ZIOFF_011355 [Zingiber officinale]